MIENRFLELLSEDKILSLQNDTKAGVIDELSALAASKCPVPFNILRDAILDREELVSTGLGHGLAIPHIRLTNFGTPLILVGISENGIPDYLSTDSIPIKVVVMLAADGRDTELYLEMLKSISARLKTLESVSAVAQCYGDSAANILAKLRQL